nr:DUF2827 family protein [Cupriavidus sp. BIC8F]
MAPAGVSVIGLEAAMGRLDLLIETGAQLGPETVERARAQGARVIAYRVGNDYVMEIERVVAGKHGTGIFNGVRFDRQDPSGIGDIFVTNAIDLKRHEAFERFALRLDIVQAGKASFEARYSTPHFLARFTDVVVTHQWENGLNYLYYDAAYGRYPLVHNSDLLPGFGYQYASSMPRTGPGPCARRCCTTMRGWRSTSRRARRCWMG